MRNSEITLVKEFVEEVEMFLDDAKKYIAENPNKKYPKVYFAKTKDGKYGVTLPGVFDIGHSANNCPDGYNSLEFATAWAMKVEALLKMGNYTYLEWCKKYNYLNRKNNDWVTGMEYIRRDLSKEEEGGKSYALYIPVTGKGYKRVPNSKDEINFTSLKKALFRRDQKLYTLVNRGSDESGVLPDNRIRKYKRLLIKGYFQSLFIFKQPIGRVETREERNDRYNKNKNAITNVFANAIVFCEDEKLKDTFEFMKALFEGNLSSARFDEFDEKIAYLEEYFKAISLFPDTVSSIIGIAKNEMKYANIAMNNLLAKYGHKK